MLAVMAGAASAGSLTIKNEGWFTVGFDQTAKYEKDNDVKSGTQDGTLLIGQERTWHDNDGNVKVGHRIALDGWGWNWVTIPKEGHTTVRYWGNVFAGNQAHYEITHQHNGPNTNPTSGHVNLPDDAFEFNPHPHGTRFVEKG